ncbi:NUDIX hydrolase [Pseudogemmobacter hezensis]|uniref:NUDIX hydrolase n=1 Tax=Pseudogemmobacter hezensis TaxID=2737662 RepID=UPI0020A69D6D|nr:NUDIX hydrolase [Pseudogemmobacter hezensis]
MEPKSQLAALCWSDGKDGRRVLLITSRDTGRWVLPKGWPMKDRSFAEAARIEAWEEAGVTGTISETALGQYAYDKVICREADLAQACEVEVFALKVASLARKYPEHRQRRRKWFSPEKAARKVDEPELRQLILDFGAAAPAADASMPEGHI